MRKKYALFFVVIMLCFLFEYTSKKFTKNMELCYNFSISYDMGTIEHLAIVVHQTQITDIEKCAREIIEHIEKNDFENIRFNYVKKEYPIEIHATVYLNKKDFNTGKYIFKMAYKQDAENNFKYNMIDNPEKFYLEIE